MWMLIACYVSEWISFLLADIHVSSGVLTFNPEIPTSMKSECYPRTQTMSTTNNYTGFPLAQKERLLDRECIDFNDQPTTMPGFCNNDEACEAAIELLNKLLGCYLSTNEDDIRTATLDKYNMFLSIVASIAYTLNESGQVESFTNPKHLPKFVTESQFATYLSTTYQSYYTLAGVNVQFTNGIVKGVDSAIRLCIDMYKRYTSGEPSHETIYTQLLERRFPPNRDINGIRIYPFPEIDDYIHFIEGGYDADILSIPAKYRYMIYDKDAEIKNLTERVNMLKSTDDNVSDHANDQINVEANDHVSDNASEQINEPVNVEPIEQPLNQSDRKVTFDYSSDEQIDV